ncbi:universal stress protein [Cupriavidus metallidurans]|uniref:universal stress protein n=1 Tax=Cupriavidus metallidurans TaxID=119219 RepID=UPI001BFC1A3C|nr:universal stress protein [Cupriavidus metallidurans]QWC92305.1 universal stress protein [Cupriavidus metallidurans]
MYRNIMVPIDDSHCSSRALDEAVRLARATGSNLEIIHVIDYGFLRVRAHGGELEEEHQHRVAAGNALLVKARHHAERAGIKFTERLLDDKSTLGDVANRLIHDIQDSKPDLVVIGTHGKSGLQRVVLGSVAETLVRHASVPVLVVRGDIPLAEEATAGQSTTSA